METQVHTKTITSVRVTNDYQDTGSVVLTVTNCRRLFRTWRFTIGRNLLDKARIRDTYIKIELRFVHDENHHMIVLHDLVTLYMTPAESVMNKIDQ
jgi:hypothetical protein